MQLQYKNVEVDRLTDELRPLNKKVTVLDMRLKNKDNEWHMREYEIRRDFKRTEKAYKQLLSDMTTLRCEYDNLKSYHQISLDMN